MKKIYRHVDFQRRQTTKRHIYPGVRTYLLRARKFVSLLMRACRCVNERRSHSSEEVIGQYQSQLTDKSILTLASLLLLRYVYIYMYLHLLTWIGLRVTLMRFYT